jgi:hypothetical protein
MTQSSRRNFLKTSAASSLAIAGASGIMIDSAKAQSTPPSQPFKRGLMQYRTNYLLKMA